MIRRLEAGVQEQRIDQAFVDGLVSEIALAVGVPAEPSYIQNELARSKREKEDAAESKQRMEEDFMDQVMPYSSFGQGVYLEDRGMCCVSVNHVHKNCGSLCITSTPGIISYRFCDLFKTSKRTIQSVIFELSETVVLVMKWWFSAEVG